MLICSGTSFAQEHNPDEQVGSSYPAPLGLTSLAESWLDPWPHRHFSRRGTPLTHLFSLEPAFLDSDVFLNYHHFRGEDGQSHEAELAIEWALTRRIGIELELPFVHLNPDPGETETGIGDVAAGARFLLIDTSRFILSANVEVETPTGSERRGLGDGETKISPTLSFWVDLGHWISWSGQFGSEHGLKSGQDEILYATAISFVLSGPALFDDEEHEGHGHEEEQDEHEGAHFPPGLITLSIEFSGGVSLSGRERGNTSTQFLFGAGYALTDRVELRGAMLFPMFKPRDFDNGYQFGVVFHF
jgi:hypothetical protein